mmetsp:Transcript_2069/g.7379  ORF Transcript_2069/g.7379 Transcript_2069/m.7379 type:complete len:222 (-) Transcript_2069:1990-2655(-)
MVVLRVYALALERESIRFNSFEDVSLPIAMAPMRDFTRCARMMVFTAALKRSFFLYVRKAFPIFCSASYPCSTTSTPRSSTSCGIRTRWKRRSMTYICSHMVKQAHAMITTTPKHCTPSRCQPPPKSKPSGFLPELQSSRPREQIAPGGGGTQPSLGSLLHLSTLWREPLWKRPVSMIPVSPPPKCTPEAPIGSSIRWRAIISETRRAMRHPAMLTIIAAQ